MHDAKWRQIPILHRQLQSLPEGLRHRLLISVHCKAAGKRMLRRPPSILYVSHNTYDAEKN